ncbi:amidohydrolase family protein [Variovorax sp. J31P207]|uniref:amidohydrolase family protein n=1 Tax=Variovorax sp. J31P207 TaxID=3053510 RepID=UPI002577DB7C|nr:amidohydrolase family protein [Variovorax sp. J31P207]MDM0070274.1 amidohydrolase family protein [Variovorax sp. J31P207]
MRIDAHQHYWSPAHGDYGWLVDTPALHAIHRDFTPADLAPLLDRAGIDGTVLVQAAPSEAETWRLLALAAEPASRVRAVVGWTALDAPDAPARIRRLAQQPLLRGLRPMLQDLPDPEWVLGDALLPAWAAMIEQGLVLDLLIRPHQIDAARRLALRHPGLAMVVDHGAKPAIAAGGFEPWAGDMARLAAATRVHCKLSGLATEAGPGWRVDTLRPYVGHLLRHFGPARMMWGSDWPVLNLAGDYRRWQVACDEWLAELPAPERAGVWGTNAARFYGIK